MRKHELSLTEIALAKVTNQYLEYLDVLKDIEINEVGDFIEVASVLIEKKARAVLPRNEIEEQIYAEDPRADLVQRLLMYKEFKDASIMLDDRASRWQNRFRRMADDMPTKSIDMSMQPIKEVELWDLVSSFGRILRDNLPKPQANIVYDETPIQIYMEQIHGRLVEEQRVPFSSLFQPGMHKSAMVGVFLAVLELARHHNVRTEQDDLHGEIFVVTAEGFQRDASFADADDYGMQNLKPGDPSELLMQVQDRKKSERIAEIGRANRDKPKKESS